MAQLTVKINGYPYLLQCEDGQEEHLQAMAAHVESRIEDIKAHGNQSGEARLLVLAALLLSDELHDLRAEMAQMSESAGAPSAPVGGGKGAARSAKPDRDMARSLARMASRAEEIATSLERP